MGSGSLFRRALIGEFTANGAAAFLVLLAITLTTQVIRFLGDAAGGTIGSDGVLPLLGFSALSYLPVLLSLTAFIAVLLALSRSHRDSEMVIWFGAGLSLTRWIRPVLGFALPIIATIALLALFLTPWALRKGEEFQRQMEARDDASLVAPGLFKESRQADQVYFVETFNADLSRVNNIFARSVRQRREGVMVARQGYVETAPNGDRFLVLLDGRRYEGEPGSAEYRIVEFQRYAMRVEAHEAKNYRPSTKTRSSMDLWRLGHAEDLAELSWRLGLPVSGLILALAAIPLSFVNPRSGRSLNLLAALVLFIIYSNCMSIAQAWIAQGEMGFFGGLGTVHGGLALILGLLFFWRTSPLRLRKWRF